MEVYDEDKHNIREVINSGKTVCVQFSAKWCGPCKRITPEMNKLAEENKSIEFYYVDVDEWEEIVVKVMMVLMYHNFLHLFFTRMVVKLQLVLHELI